ncbi:MAG: DUF3796 domain-containing protein [Defluviitaleaceae bacterium]|nr:DUF3796 domain-containing protein [Defluviitaleaceae bacterium]MCL2275606.1 DUF3796 domain-containing protein [Defluviitaleaceae bacterium]
MKNKLAYLGFLGLLGFAGFFATPLLFSFFASFIFFQYIKTVPDELFWQNVRICATRSFFIFLVPSHIILVIALLLAADDNFYRYASAFAIGGFALTLGVCDFIFCASLSRLEAKERQSINDEDDS